MIFFRRKLAIPLNKKKKKKKRKKRLGLQLEGGVKHLSFTSINLYNIFFKKILII